MSKPVVINIPILNTDYGVVVFVHDDLRRVEPLLQKHGQSTDALTQQDRDAKGLTFTRTIPPCIYLPAFPTQPDEYGTLAHEACHAVEAIFEHIGQPLGQEVFAHSVGAVVREVLDCPQNR